MSRLVISLVFALCVASPVATYAQSSSANSGTVRGSVIDPSGGAIRGAAVEIQNPVSHYDKTVETDTQGNYEFDNVPFNNYHLTATAKGFQGGEEDINVRSPVPVEAKMSLMIGTSSQSVTVTAGTDLVETDTTTHTDVDRELFDKLPLESQSSELSSLATLASPGTSADSNGLFHGLGDHASNSFSIDGQPITDQQSKVFSNQLPVDAVQSMEVIEGAPPAEYGGKTSLVLVVTTRSGLGSTTPHGDITTSYGSFGTTNDGFDFSYGGEKWGNYISGNGLDTGRFLDGPQFQVLHDRGNEENIFDRVDYKLSDQDSINLNLQFTRSWFQTPNSYDAELATAWNGLTVNNGGLGPNGLPVGSADQRSKINTFNIAPVWTRLINPKTVFTFGAWVRQDQYGYYPSANPFADLTSDPGFAGVGQSASVGQYRRLMNIGARSSVSYVSGIHNIKVGVQYEHTLLTERDTFGLVDPTGNAPCLNANLTPDTNPLLTDPAGCTGTLQPNLGQGIFANGDPVPAFNPILACYDLTRTAPLPASDGCPNGTSGEYTYGGRGDIREFAFYIQDAINIQNWTFNLGLRIDQYDGISSNWQPEPRLGIAYNIKPSNTVLRISYARTMESPFNENLVLASLGCTNPVIAAFQTLVPGGACVTTSPLTPGLRNEFHAGISQAFGKYLVLDGEYIWKYTHNAFDFSVLANTPITYPIEWTKSKIPGYAIRLSMPNFHGLSAFMVTSSVAARFFSPQVAGVGATPVGFGVFRIDHDELYNATGHLQYQPPSRKAPWFAFNWRFDSGLVAGPVPCAGGEACPNGPGGTDSVVSVLNLTPDQQYEGGLYCGPVHATAPGTENNDHNPQRIAPRNLYDIAVGHDNIFHGDKYKWSARLTVVNLANSYVLYNFLSTFSGTHYVTPRTITGTIGFHF
jgi:Carboxypeptidase regulatory-like domain/TonB-dependent Receptor Plug Domain